MAIARAAPLRGDAECSKTVFALPEYYTEVVADGENGYIVPIGNEKAIALKLQELIIDRKKRECMGKAGRKRVEELYDWEKNVDTMEKLYEEVRVKKE